MDQLIRLSTLFVEQDKILNILIRLNNVGLIAGGSVVYALNTFVNADTISDIDVFVNSAENFWKAVNIVKSEYENIEYEIYDYYHDNRCSVVNLLIPGEKINIQIIYKYFDTPHDIINNFDIDYVACGIMNNELHIIPECELSHSRRQVFHIKTLTPHVDRFIKAINKGFTSPVIGKYKPEAEINKCNWPDLCELEICPMMHNEYISQNIADNWINIENISIINFIITQYTVSSSINGKFNLRCGKFNLLVDMISHEIDIDYYLKMQYKSFIFSTSHQYFNRFEYNTNIKMPSKHIFMFDACIDRIHNNYNSREYNFTCNMIRILKNSISIPFADDFDIIINLDKTSIPIDDNMIVSSDDDISCDIKLPSILSNLKYYKPCNLLPQHQYLVNKDNIISVIKYIKYVKEFDKSSYDILITLLQKQNEMPFKDAIKECYELLEISPKNVHNLPELIDFAI